MALAGTGQPDRNNPVNLLTDGMRRSVDAGGRIRLAVGESVTLFPGQWHAFWAEGADCLIGEVSAVNDDLTDNVFLDDIGRFSDIQEDADPVRLLVSDYEKYFGSPAD